MKEENQTIIKAINMFGRVPEMWELLNEIERLNNIINELEKYIKTDAKIELYKDVSGFRTFVDGQDLLNKLQELKGDDKE